jgi:hypothetical protein
LTNFTEQGDCAQFYFEEDPGRRAAAKLLDEARRIAANIAVRHSNGL